MRVGARLMGHVKFMQLFLNEIYEQMKSIPVGWYLNKPYDMAGSNFDGLCKYDKGNDKKPVNLEVVVAGGETNTNAVKISFLCTTYLYTSIHVLLCCVLYVQL